MPYAQCIIQGKVFQYTRPELQPPRDTACDTGFVGFNVWATVSNLISVYTLRDREYQRGSQRTRHEPGFTHEWDYEMK